MQRRSLFLRASALFLSLSSATAIDLDVTDQASIKHAAGTMAGDLMASYRPSNNAPGLFPAPYYWWESGAVWGGMIDYWYLTGDDQYNSIVGDALLSQVGPNGDYMPPNQTKSEGNDDQAFWALAALSAAERSFPGPSSSPQYLSLAEAVFDDQVLRWDNKTCGGGLRWQIFTFNDGYNYKISSANGAFFQLAARLAVFTGNQTYADWAETAYAWSEKIGLVKNGIVFDGVDVTTECGVINHLQWTLDQGLYLYGSAVMYNLTASPTWQNRTSTLLNGAKVFFPDNQNIVSEVACEPRGTCNTDQQAYKALLSRWLSRTAVSAPYTQDTISPLIRSSAQAAAKQCSGGTKGTTCGSEWMTGKYDGSSGLGQTLSALEIVQANLVPVAKGLVTGNGTAAGGNQSAGGAGAGASSSSGAGASRTATASSVASSTPTGASAVVFVPFTLLLAAGVLTAVLGLN